MHSLLSFIFDPYYTNVQYVEKHEERTHKNTCKSKKKSNKTSYRLAHKKLRTLKQKRKNKKGGEMRKKKLSESNKIVM